MGKTLNWRIYNGIQVEMDYISKFKQSVKRINVENNESYAVVTPPGSEAGSKNEKGRRISMMIAFFNMKYPQIKFLNKENYLWLQCN